MKKKRVAQNVKVAELVTGLTALSEEMSYAMMSANLHYIATSNQMTARMSDVWLRFINFARLYTTERG